MILEFEMRRSYGHNRYYPINRAAEVIVEIAGRVCLNEDAIQSLKLAGFDVRLSWAGGLVGT